MTTTPDPPHSRPASRSPLPDPLADLPPPIREIAARVADTYETSPAPVAASLLAVLAAALGPTVRCLLPGRVIPVGFNILTVTPDRSPARQGWLEFLQSPLAVTQQRHHEEAARLGPERLRARQRELERDAGQFRPSTDPDRHTEPFLLAQGTWAQLARPRLIEASPSPQRLAWAIRHSADGSILLGEGLVSLAADLGAERPAEIRRLTRWLRESWAGDPLLMDGRIAQPGHLSVVRTLPEPDLQRAPLADLLAEDPPLPILFCRQEMAARHLPDGAIDDLSAGLLALANRAFRVRLLRRPLRLRVDPAAYPELDHFATGLKGEATQSWWPDLVIRLAALFGLHQKPNEPIGEERIGEDAVASACRWLSGTLADPHRAIAASIVSPASVREERARLRLTDNEQRIYHRITQRPGLGRRELQRSLSGVTADQRNEALTELFLRNLVRADAAGRLFGA